MTDIFISYARADREKIERLASALEQAGYAVWWDRQIVGGDDFSEDIERELGAAKAVIVGWSDAGSKSKWVKDEASIAADAGKMIAVSLDGADPPIGYRQYHCLDLSHWKGDGAAPAFVEVSRAVEARLKGEPPPAAVYDRDGAERNSAKVLLIAAAIAVVVVAGAFLLMRGGGEYAETENAEVAAPAIDRSKSIAVLPFDDFSEGDQAWFADGLTEEILNALARTPDLMVASRTSSFVYKETDEEIPVIAERLGVEHVLEGSVRRAGDRLRVAAQLIRANDGFHLWSENYDRSADDIIAIQEEIATEIAKALKTAMDPDALADMVAAGTRSIDAYEAHLRGLALDAHAIAVGEYDLELQAYDAFERARAIDANFAEPQYRAAEFWLLSMNLANTLTKLSVSQEEALANFTERIDLAIKNARDEAFEKRYRAAKDYVLGRYRDAIAGTEAYLKAHPNDLEERRILTTQYVRLGEYEKATALIRETEKIAGDDFEALYNTIAIYFIIGLHDDAARLSRRVLALAPDHAGALFQAQRAFLWAGANEEAKKAAAAYRRVVPSDERDPLVDIREACAAGDRARAERLGEAIFGDEESRIVHRWIAYQLLGRRQDAERLLAPLDTPRPLHRIQGFILFPYFDPAPFPNIARVLEREGAKRRPPTAIPYACPPADENAIDEKSIAVLPFQALSADESDEYFGKGVAEELLNELAKFPELKVAARTSAFSFEEKDVDIPDIARQLGVAHVLEGSVRRAGDRLRITAQLIRAEDGFHLWSETYDRDVDDIFAVEDEIVREISRTLEVRLGVGAGAGRAGGDGVDANAYEQYLKGLTLWGDRDRAASNRPDALKAFQNAAGFDPDFADAWAAIGVVGAFSYPFQFGVTHDELEKFTETAFQKALALDQQNAIAHAGLVIWRLGKPDITAAKTHLDQALSLTPNRAELHYAAAHFWMVIGDAESAVAAFERAVALDPLNMIVRRNHAIFLSAIGRFDEAFTFNDECHASRCLAEGFPAHVMFQAIYSGDPERIRKWLPIYEELETFAVSLPPTRRPTPMFAMPAAVSIAADRPELETQIAEAHAYLTENVVREEVGMWGPVLAQMLPADVILDSIESAAEYGTFARSAQTMPQLYGTNPWPEEILRHPRYHALWARSGMAELAAARRANGWEDGLPLPMENTGE